MKLIALFLTVFLAVISLGAGFIEIGKYLERQQIERQGWEWCCDETGEQHRKSVE
jgi:hypothetical protein